MEQQFSVLCNFTVDFTFVSLLQQHCIYLSLSKGKKIRTSIQSLDSRWTSQNFANIIIVLTFLKKKKKSSLQRSVDEIAVKISLLGVPYLSLAESMKQFSNVNNLKFSLSFC